MFVKERLAPPGADSQSPQSPRGAGGSGGSGGGADQTVCARPPLAPVADRLGLDVSLKRKSQSMGDLSLRQRKRTPDTASGRGGGKRGSQDVAGAGNGAKRSSLQNDGSPKSGSHGGGRGDCCRHAESRSCPPSPPRGEAPPQTEVHFLLFWFLF